MNERTLVVLDRNGDPVIFKLELNAARKVTSVAMNNEMKKELSTQLNACFPKDESSQFIESAIFPTSNPTLFFTKNMNLFAVDLRTYKLRYLTKISDPKHMLWAQADFEYDDEASGASEVLSVFSVGSETFSSLYFFSVTKLAMLEVQQETEQHERTIYEIKYFPRLKLLFIGGEGGMEVLQLRRSPEGKYSTKTLCSIDMPGFDLFVLEIIPRTDTTFWIAFAGSGETIQFVEVTKTEEVGNEITLPDMTVRNSADAAYGLSIKPLHTFRSPNESYVVPHIHCLTDNLLATVDGDGNVIIWNILTKHKRQVLTGAFPQYMYTYERQFVLVLSQDFLILHDVINDEQVLRYDAPGLMGAELSTVPSYANMLQRLLVCSQRQQLSDVTLMFSR